MKLYAIILAGLLLALCIAPAAADDVAVGTWKVTGTMPFLFFNIPCADGTLTLNENGTGVATGTAKLIFFDVYSMNEEKLTWEKIGINTYQLTFPYAVVNVNYNPDGDLLSARVNPSQFGAPIPVDVDGTASRV